MPLEATTEPPFGNIKRQMNKLMDQVQKGFYTFSPGETWTPNVNLYENDASYVVCVDLAGVNKDEIDLNVRGQTLTLKGCRQVPVQQRDAPSAGGGGGGGGGDSPSTPPRYRVHLME